MGEAAALVSAMIELSELEAQGERLALAELRALRAQISPHFIYNALAAVASFIHSRPEEARELLIEFSDFIRYAFARQRPYVTLADELQYVEKYLRLEQARFGERLRVRVRVDPEVLQAVVPVLSLQPLVENAVRHGVESRARRRARRDRGPRPRRRRRAAGVRRRRRASTPSARAAALAGRGPGSASATCRRACSRPSAAGYGLVVESETGDGTTVVMTLPKFRAGVRAGMTGDGLRAARGRRRARPRSRTSCACSRRRRRRAGRRRRRRPTRRWSRSPSGRFDALFLDVRMPGPRRARARARAAPVRAPAGGRVRLGLRRLRRATRSSSRRSTTSSSPSRGSGSTRRSTASGRAGGRAPAGRALDDDCCPSTRRAAATRLLARSLDPLPAGPRRLRARRRPTTGASCCARALADLEERWSRHGFAARPPRLRRQPAPRGRGAAAAQRHRGAA